MKVGYAPSGAPSDGMGPFGALFNSAVNLARVSSLQGLDAVILWGGADISPSLYDEQPYGYSGPHRPSSRDTFEWSIIAHALEAKIPIIGICRGAQMLCAYAGGKLVQDVTNHHATHPIITNTGERFLTSSCHHQMMVPWEIDHELIAWSEKHQSTHYHPPEHPAYSTLEKHIDKEPEVVYFPKLNGFGVQGHPEWHSDVQGQRFNTWMLDVIMNKCFKV
jgi:putative glutamine amidotransferase